jgi:tetrahydromethanopterin S-methyltransferase subunit B
LFAELIQAGVYSIGLSSASAGVVASLLTGIVLVLVLVAVIALILKVRP